MNRKITIQQPHPKAAPCAVIPSKYMWDLVEYLAYQRTQVHYTYGETHFYVRFLRLGPAAAQRLLDQWAESDATLPSEEALTQTHGALMSSF